MARFLKALAGILLLLIGGWLIAVSQSNEPLMKVIVLRYGAMGLGGGLAASGFGLCNTAFSKPKAPG